MPYAMTNENPSAPSEDEEIDPISDIIDYLIRCAKISFKNTHVDDVELRTSEKIRLACDIYHRSPTDFLRQFGKHLSPSHLEYFEKCIPSDVDGREYLDCVAQLKHYHSKETTSKRVRNRRYKAMEKMKNETDYFTDKEMMQRNPLLYEQLVGQYLSDEEIKERDGIDNVNLTFLSMILETVDRNEMRETKNQQLLDETECESKTTDHKPKPKQWGEFETPDAKPSYMPEPRMQSMINAPERQLLYEEFLHEMYSSFIDGNDTDIDYHSIDNDEQYDDMIQVSRDAEDKYFDSETNEGDNLEEHMNLVDVYGKKESVNSVDADPLDEFMLHMSNKQNVI